MNFEASSEGEETERQRESDERRNSRNSYFALATDDSGQKEGDGLATTKIAAQVDGGGESIILDFCLTDPL